MYLRTLRVLARCASRSFTTSIHMHPLSSQSQVAVDHFDHALECYVGQRGNADAAARKAIATDPAMVIAQALRLAVLVFQGADASSLGRQAADLQRLSREHTLTAREGAVIAAVTALARGYFRRAAAVLEGALLVHESSGADALVSRLLHDTYSALGDNVALRGSIARSFQVRSHLLRYASAKHNASTQAWDPSMPMYAQMMAMLSWGFVESGALERAEESGMAALHMDPQVGVGKHSQVGVVLAPALCRKAGQCAVVCRPVR